MGNKIDHEPAFAWRVKDILRRQDRLIKKIKARFAKWVHKFVIDIPNINKRKST